MRTGRPGRSWRWRRRSTSRCSIGVLTSSRSGYSAPPVPALRGTACCLLPLCPCADPWHYHWQHCHWHSHRRVSICIVTGQCAAAKMPASVCTLQTDADAALEAFTDLVLDK